MSLLTYATAQVLRVVPRQWVGRTIGGLAERSWSPRLGRAVVGLYSRVYDVSFDDCAQTTGFRSFDAFFTRALRDGTRPLDPDPLAMVSPADGRIETMTRVDDESIFQVKGSPYRVADLLGSQNEAARYNGGWGCVVYLSPRDYHRVHSPVRGNITEITSLPGDYYPVNSIGLAHIPNLFARNRRVVLAIDTERQGRIAMVMVAAMIVGKITVNALDSTHREAGRTEERAPRAPAAYDVPYGRHVLDPPVAVERGEEVGAFHLGSTVVVLAERRAAGRWLLPEGAVRVRSGILGGVAREALEESNGQGRKHTSSASTVGGAG